MALESMGLKKLGHPVPESNLVDVVKSGDPHPAHWNDPGVLSFSIVLR